MKQLKEIFIRELERLDTTSMERALNLTELRSLDLLTKSLRTYKENALESNDGMEDASIEELLAWAKGDYDDEDTEEDA